MTELADVLPYLMTIIGFLIVYVLNGIKSEIKEVKTTVKSLENDMRGGIGDLDRRITAVESRCLVYHEMDRRDPHL